MKVEGFQKPGLVAIADGVGHRCEYSLYGRIGALNDPLRVRLGLSHDQNSSELAERGRDAGAWHRFGRCLLQLGGKFGNRLVKTRSLIGRQKRLKLAAVFV